MYEEFANHRDAYEGRLIAANQLITYRYEGFWAPMDTLKERTALEDMYRRGISPWALWKERRGNEVRTFVPVPEIKPAL